MKKTNNKTKNIYTVLKIKEKSNGILFNTCDIFKSEEDAVNFYHREAYDHIKKHKLYNVQYLTKYEPYEFSTYKGEEDVYSTIRTHSIEDIKNQTLYIITIGIKKPNKFVHLKKMTGYTLVFTSKEMALAEFNKITKELIEKYKLNKNEYILSEDNTSFITEHNLNSDNINQIYISANIEEKEFE